MLSVKIAVLFPLLLGAAGASEFTPSGWNTWDIARPNAFIHMPDGITLEFTLYDPQTGKSLGRPYLKNVRHFGAHAPDGSYCRAIYQQGDLSYEIEFAGRSDLVVAHVHPLNRTSYRLSADLSFAFGRSGTIEKRDDGLVIRGRNSVFYVRSPQPWESAAETATGGRLLSDLSGDRWVTLSTDPPRAISEEICRTHTASFRDAYEKDRVRSGGFLEDGAQALSDLAAWNMVWSPPRNLPVATVAREFPAGSGITWGGYIQGGWDAVFQALMANLESGSMAEATIRGLLADAAPSGLVGGGSGWGLSEDHSQPPLAAYALLKFYKSHHSRKPLEESFPILLRWHRWWPVARDGNHNGLLEWGSNPVSAPRFVEYNTKVLDAITGYFQTIGRTFPALKASDMMDNGRQAGYESGLDNSQMWDDVKFNQQTHTFEQDDVFLTSLYALDAWALAEIAHIIGRGAEEQTLRRDYSETGDRINRMLWSVEDGIYLNRHWDGTFNRRIAPTNFCPLLANVATPARARGMVERYLLDPQKFWGDYVVPVTPRDDPAFRDNSYWRGRIWAPTNYLLYEGLKRSGLDDVAAAVAGKSSTLFLKEWRTKGHGHENYNSVNGEGDDVLNSVSYYAWAGLLPLMMVEELIDIEVWGSGLRIGSLSDKSASVSHVRVLDDTYDLSLGPGLRVTRNGEAFLESGRPIVIRNLVWGPREVTFDVSAAAATNLALSGFARNEKLRLGSPPRPLIADDTGRLQIQVEPQPKKIQLLRGQPATR